MHVKPILLVVGTVLLGLAAFMLVPALLATAYGEDSATAFYQSTLVSALVGGAFVAYSARARVLIYPKQTFVITGLSWIGVSLFGALPFVIYTHIGFADAVFETASGITTTGSTVLVGLDAMPRSVLLWRSILQGIGGLGFTVMAIAVLPFLGVGGMRLFRSESSDWSEKSTPRMRSLALLITVAYVALILACTLAYGAAGMSWFDAINHAMPTVSTGGFSTHDASFAHFASPTIEWIGVVFMLLGSLPFTLYVKALQDRGVALVRDEQVRAFLLIATSVTVMVTASRVIEADRPLLDALRESAFNVVSVISTTGFASADYSLWGPFATMAIFYTMFVGGCSGSTSGGFKVFRLQIGVRVLRNQIQRQIHPNGVFTLTFNRRVIDDDVVKSLIGFSLAFFASIAVIAFGLAAFGLDFVTSISSAVTAVANVGPGLGPIVGPAGNFSTLPDGAKWLMAAGMLLGRLEVMTLIILLNRKFWQS
jgi:trk system potassium uptake protein TrkH